MAEKSVFTVDIGDETKKFVTYKNSDYSNIYCQTYTKNAQAVGKYLDKMINQSNQYGIVNKVIILKYETLQGIASYDHVSHVLYICEELIDKELFLEKVDETYFPSRTVEDVLNHELGGHKKHWEAV